MTNYLVIAADDMRADELRFMPTVRRIAAQGATFTNAWVSTPVCSPWRASFLSGQRPSGPNGHGIVEQADSQTGIEGDTVAVWADTADVKCAQIGKYFTGLIAAAKPGWNMMRASKGASQASMTGYSILKVDGGTLTGTVTPSAKQAHYLAAEAQTWLSARYAAGDDWLLWYCAHEPHTPLEGTGRYANAWSGVRWNITAEDVSDKPSWVQAIAAPSAADIAYARAYQIARLQELRDLDDTVAALWYQVVASGHADDTVLVFVSDNGDSLLEHRMPALGKGTPYDFALRVPLVAYGPGFTGKGTITAPVAADVDITAMIVAGASLTPTTPQDGTDLAAIAATPGDYTTRGILGYCETQSVGGSTMPSCDIWTQVQSGTRYKLIRYQGQTGTDLHELYDLDADPGELSNLANDGAYAAIVTSMAAALDTELAG